MTHSINVNIEATGRPQAIWVLSDLHLGHVAFDKELFERDLAMAKKARARVLFLGDALEAVTTGSKVANLGGMFDQTCSIGDQEDMFMDYMNGMRVLACVEGNHEARITRTTGTSPFRNICRFLTARQNYRCAFLPHGGYVKVKVGSQTYPIVAHHGEGPAAYFKLMKRDWPDGEIFVAGHTHELCQSEQVVRRLDGTRQRYLTCRTGSYLDDPSYAATRPTSGGIPATGSHLLWLYPDRKKMFLEKMSDRAS